MANHRSFVLDVVASVEGLVRTIDGWTVVSPRSSSRKTHSSLGSFSGFVMSSTKYEERNTRSVVVPLLLKSACTTRGGPLPEGQLVQLPPNRNPPIRIVPQPPG